MRLVIVLALSIATAFTISFGVVGSAGTDEAARFFAEPQFADGESKSLNWSGYVAHASDNAFDNVKGSWQQPAVKCSAGSRQSAIYWIGIDGFTSEIVEQIGTGTECRNGTPVYFAWYEFYPAPAKVIRLSASRVANV